MQAVKVPRLEGGSIGSRMEIWVNCDGPISMVPCLHQGNIPKGSYGYGETRNAFCLSVQSPHLPVRGVKIPRLEGGSTGSRTESWVNCDGNMAMVACLH